jgi:hypothetical protein
MFSVVVVSIRFLSKFTGKNCVAELPETAKPPHNLIDLLCVADNLSDGNQSAKLFGFQIIFTKVKFTPKISTLSKIEELA